jgi:signal transduction histidine kinase/CheY-like chemotaxis protein
MAFIGFISGKKHIFIIAGILMVIISYYAFYNNDVFYKNNFPVFLLVLAGYSIALHFFVKTTHGFIQNLEQVTQESDDLKNIAEERMRDQEEANAVLEERQKEINLQKEEILTQYESLENSNMLLQQSQAKILEQNSELDKHRNQLEFLVEERTQALEKALLKAEGSDKLKTSFLSNMSHEIRTPMNAIIGFATLLKDESINENRYEYINIIESNGLMLLTLINDILDLSSIQSQQVSLKPKNTNLYGLLTNLLETFKIDTDKKDLTLKLNTDQIKDDCHLIFDEIRLKQVLSNLLSNACKFTESGYIEFGVHEITDTVTFFVKDTGLGIPKGSGISIFDRFYKIENCKDQLYRGTGLGLSLCKSIVTLWNGDIWFESELGKGTTFFFTYPLSSENQSKNKQPKGIANGSLDLTGKRILIAEDEVSNFKLLEIYFKGTRAEILWAKNGAEAIQCVKDHRVDLILMDVKMPTMNGLEATKKIKELMPELPIVAQTAFAFSNEIEEILRSGVNAYITKPINKTELFDLISRFV